MNIDIIGAGIGGLTTAIALEQKGINTTIFEQAKKIKPVGLELFWPIMQCKFMKS